MLSYRDESLDPLPVAEGMVGMGRQTMASGRPDLGLTSGLEGTVRDRWLLSFEIFRVSE